MNRAIIDCYNANIDKIQAITTVLNTQNISIDFSSFIDIEMIPKVLRGLGSHYNSVIRFYTKSIFGQDAMSPSHNKNWILRKSYILIDKSSRKLMHFSKCIIEYSQMLRIPDSGEVKINYKDIASIQIEISPSKIKSLPIGDLFWLMKLDQYSIVLNKWIIKKNYFSLSQI